MRDLSVLWRQALHHAQFAELRRIIAESGPCERVLPMATQLFALDG